MEIKKAIHLLYVPTIFCNMSCKYCYLGDETNIKVDNKRAVETLRFTIDKFTKNGYIPYNLSFHGGEVTTLSSLALEELFQLTKDYYQNYKKEIKSLGFKTTPIHIKTNLYNFKKHYEIFDKYKVSISGSVDLPLFLHEKYRVNKNGNSTLPKILENLKLLANYPHNKKISCVVTKEHLNYIDKFIEDILYIHNDIGLDMTKFNIMFSFDSDKNQKKFKTPIVGTEMLNYDEQLLFYKKIYESFSGSDLDYGLRTHWFKEFTPDFCCSAINCGNKFFLVQDNGEVYSCPRGQSSKNYYYGNIFNDNIEDIVSNGWKQIESNENRMDIDDECLSCEYFPYCNLGCPFVRDETKDSKSYTCKLQKEIYKDNPEKYPAYEKNYIDEYVKKFLYVNKIDKIKDFTQKREQNITYELYDNKNSIANIIKKDKILKELYSDDLFLLEVESDDKKEIYNLSSQILKNSRDIIFLDSKSKISLYAREDIFSINATPNINNFIYMMLLRDTPIVYGDEERLKQLHLFDFTIYKNVFIDNSIREKNYYKFDLTDIFRVNSYLFKENIKNNLFFTTKTMRDYHYTKHKKNAFYHIQAINLPFSNIEFYWF